MQAEGKNRRVYLGLFDLITGQQRLANRRIAGLEVNPG